jgi:hypothetical protein
MLHVVKRSIKFVGCGNEIELLLRPEVSVVPNNRSQSLSCFFWHRAPHRGAGDAFVASKYEKIMDDLISSVTAVAMCQSNLSESQGKI